MTKWLIAAAIAASTPLLAADLSTPLSLDHARALVSAMGFNVGRQFCTGGPQCAGDDDRYMLSRIESHAKGRNVFVIEVEITPLPKHTGQ